MCAVDATTLFNCSLIPNEKNQVYWVADQLIQQLTNETMTTAAVATAAIAMYLAELLLFTS